MGGEGEEEEEGEGSTKMDQAKRKLKHWSINKFFLCGFFGEIFFFFKYLKILIFKYLKKKNLKKKFFENVFDGSALPKFFKNIFKIIFVAISEKFGFGWISPVFPKTGQI